MMAQKHLHEFLEHVQDPFLLQNYIADRRSKLKRPPPYKKSSPPSDAAVLADLHIPSPTAALLLESALRIFHYQSAISPTPRFQGLPLFGTLFNNLLNPSSSSSSSSSMSDHVHPDEEGETEEASVSRRNRSSPPPKRRVPFCLSVLKGATFNRLAPGYSSPAASPIGRREEFFNGAKIQLQGGEEEKELRSSPVSVLEPDPFKDDEDGEDKKATIQSLFCWNGENTDTKKQKLLLKLKRFERLDPRELDKTLVLSSNERRQQQQQEDRSDDEFEVIDMIVDFEMGKEVDYEWKDSSEQVAIEIELSIYGELIYDLLNDFFFLVL